MRRPNTPFKLAVDGMRARISTYEDTNLGLPRCTGLSASLSCRHLDQTSGIALILWRFRSSWMGFMTIYIGWQRTPLLCGWDDLSSIVAKYPEAI